MAKLAIPLSIVHISHAAMDFTDIIFLGNLNNNEYLAASTLATTFSFAIMTFPGGMINAEETLVSQAYGCKNEKVMRLVLYRTILMTLLIFIPIFILFSFSYYLFIPIVYTDERNMARHAGTYLYLLLPGLLPSAFYQILSGYLISQDHVLIPCVVGLTGTGLNVLFNYLLINGIRFKGLGFIGSPLSTTISRFVVLFLILFLMLIRNCVNRCRRKYKLSRAKKKNSQEQSAQSEQSGDEKKEDEPMEIDKRSPMLLALHQTRDTVKSIFRWKGVRDFLGLAIPSAALLAMDHYCFQIVSLLTARFGESYVSAHGILANLSMISYSFSNGIGSAASVRIGSMLGSKKYNRAMWYCWVSIIFGSLVMASFGGLYVGIREYIAKLMTKDVEARKIVASVMPILAAFQLFDGMQLVAGGILRGTGKQYVCACGAFFGFYLLGLPLGVILAFIADLKTFGFWCGLACAICCLGFFLVGFIFFKVDWKAESKAAIARVQRQENNSEFVDADGGISSLLVALDTEVDIRTVTSRFLNHAPKFWF